MHTAKPSATERAKNLQLMIFDVDGVLTDGSLHYGVEGEVLKTFNVLDGLGIKLLEQSGIPTAIITARNSPIISKRAADLGMRSAMLPDVVMRRRLHTASLGTRKRDSRQDYVRVLKAALDRRRKSSEPG